MLLHPSSEWTSPGKVESNNNNNCNIGMHIANNNIIDLFLGRSLSSFSGVCVCVLFSIRFWLVFGAKLFNISANMYVCVCTTPVIDWLAFIIEYCNWIFLFGSCIFFFLFLGNSLCMRKVQHSSSWPEKVQFFLCDCSRPSEGWLFWFDWLFGFRLEEDLAWILRRWACKKKIRPTDVLMWCRGSWSVLWIISQDTSDYRWVIDFFS